MGASVAYYLAKKGMTNLVLIEKGLLGGGTTGKCAGGIRTQFSTEINIRFSLLSLSIFEHFEEEFQVNPEFVRSGYLFLASREAEWELLRQNAVLMRSLGLEATLLEPGEIGNLWPFLRVEDVLGGSYTEKDGYAGPYEILKGFVRGAKGLGVTILQNREVTSVEVSGGHVRSVCVDGKESISTPWVVNAAGPWGSDVAAMAGLELPVRPVKRTLFFTDPFVLLPPMIPIIIDLTANWYIRREGKGFLLAGPQEARNSHNGATDFEEREWTAARSLHRIPALESCRIARGWSGYYEISPDHHAIMGTFPELEGFVCVNGFSGHGFQHGPAAGILISELMTEKQTRALDIHSLRPSRFREGELIYEPLTAFRD
jgi:sarcosine oxidase subunit beta